jgi:hypothetical protein
MSDELQTTWKEAIMFEMRCYPYICLEGVREITITSLRVVDVPADVDISF